MADLYRIFASKISPYSVKVRCYFGFKAIPHQWILREPRFPGGTPEIRQIADHPAAGDRATNVRRWPTRPPAIRCF